jgi:hypothetical protein
MIFSNKHREGKLTAEEMVDVLSPGREFSDWLREQLTSRRMTAAELADRAGIAKASAYFYLDGSRIPGREAVEPSTSWPEGEQSFLRPPVALRCCQCRPKNPLG